MESEDPLSQLADIHLPDPVSIWPLAPGWWVLIALFIMFLIWLSYKAFRRLILHKRLQAAQDELAKAIDVYRASTLSADADKNKAGLDYLYAVNTGNDFSEGLGKVLAEGQYRPIFAGEVEGLYTLAQNWISSRYTQKKQQSGQKKSNIEVMA